MSTIGFDINQLGNIWHKVWESLGHDFLKDNGAAICAMNTINKCMIFIKKKDLGLTGWQNLAAFRWEQKWQWNFSSSVYLQF